MEKFAKKNFIKNNKFLIIAFILIIVFIYPLNQNQIIIAENSEPDEEELQHALDDNPAEAAKLLDSIDSEDTFTKQILKKPAVEPLPIRLNFKTGEEITFAVKYGFINVGSAVFKVIKAPLPVGGRKTLMITSDARTNSLQTARQNYFVC